MDALLTLVSPAQLGLALLFTLGAGLVKGIVGFAMPMLMISGLSGFLAPDIALAALIIPTLLTNGWQALRQGWRQAWISVRRFWVFLLVAGVVMIGSAQLVRHLSQTAMLLIIGGPVTIFALLQLIGWQPRLQSPSRKIEALVAALAGLLGGLSAVWGPPTVAYLTAINTPKSEQMRVQGVIYGLGSVALFGAHIHSGVIRAQTIPLSLLLVIPALIGMWIGFQISDRIDQQTFRRATLFVLLFAGLNLLRRALF